MDSLAATWPRTALLLSWLLASALGHPSPCHRPPEAKLIAAAGLSWEEFAENPSFLVMELEAEDEGGDPPHSSLCFTPLLRGNGVS